MNQFDIPVVLFIFRRKDKIKFIIDRLSIIQPRKVYLISDGPRNDIEKQQVLECRKVVEDSINWPCEIVRNYSKKNKGIYNSIGLGAKWVFGYEDVAIFLEDDNLPEVSFFYYCKELLEYYKNDTRILWICGTNYLEDYNPEDGSSYVFTQHLLPCGWASWSDKFNKFYDGELKLLEDNDIIKKLRFEYKNKSLYNQQVYSICQTKYLLENTPERASWDHQMAFSMKINGLYGISPKVNLIKNIGVDEFSEHGGTSLRNEMTRRFCGIESKKIEFPLVHPHYMLPDQEYDKKVGNIILFPRHIRLIKFITKYVKKLIGLNEYESLLQWLKLKTNR